MQAKIKSLLACEITEVLPLIFLSLFVVESVSLVD